MILGIWIEVQVHVQTSLQFIWWFHEKLSSLHFLKYTLNDNFKNKSSAQHSGSSYFNVSSCTDSPLYLWTKECQPTSNSNVHLLYRATVPHSIELYPTVQSFCTPLDSTVPTHWPAYSLLYGVLTRTVPHWTPLYRVLSLTNTVLYCFRRYLCF